MCRQTEILNRIKDRIEQGNQFVYVRKENDINNWWFWVGTRDKIIGTSDCHYEFVFHEENTLCLEVHFENANNCSNFEQIVRYNNNLQFEIWKNIHRSITSEEYRININDDQIVQKAIKLLKKLHKAIGEELRQIIQTITPIEQPTLLLNENNNVVRTIHYEPRSREKATVVNSIHGEIQDRLKQELEKSRKYANVYLEGYFENLGYRIDLVGVKQDNTHDIFEVKPYPSATECIREALGQILHYYHLIVLEKGKNKIGKLVIVGPAELNDNDSNFLETIRQSLNDVTLEYLPCPIN